MKLPLPAAAALTGAAQAHFHLDASRCGCAVPTDILVTPPLQPGGETPQRPRPEPVAPSPAWRLREGTVMSLN